MKRVVTKKCSPFFLQEVSAPEIVFEKEDYLQRLELLRNRMVEKGFSHVLIYGDREHFAHIDYFSGFDCRFEEGLLIVRDNGSVAIAVGNEGVSQTYQIPYPFTRYLYQNFSLQGQPRGSQEKMSVILEKCGVTSQSKVGVVGYKYFNPADLEGDPDRSFDVPAYLLKEIFQAATPEQVFNFTREITGFPNGIRMTLRTAKEIAWIESAGNRTAAVMRRMIKALKPGLSERETAVLGKPGFDPVSMHPLVNFGAEKVRIGVASPTDRTLQLGEVCGICYATRGNLTSRVGVAAYDESTVAPEIQPHLDFYRYFWQTVAAWGESARVGADCDELYHTVMDRLGNEEYGMVLNPTHYSGADEWNNSSFFEGSPYKIHDGSHIQVDMIAGRDNPVMTAICEDCVVVAGESLRGALAKEYPCVFARIQERRRMIRQELGISLHEDILPMSNLNFVYFPYLLNPDVVFALEGE